MTLNDFASLLQLGVGLHAGTALLQSVAEFTSRPIVSRADRLIRLAELRIAKAKGKSGSTAEGQRALEEAQEIRSTIALKQVQFFNEYRYAAGFNAVVAALLFMLLSWVATDSSRTVSVALAVCFIFISAGPAALSLLVLWYRWHKNTESVHASLDGCQKRLLS